MIAKESFIKNRFTLLVVGVLMLVTLMPFLRGHLSVAIPLLLIVLMVGVIRTLDLPRLLIAACVAVGGLASLLHFVVILLLSGGGDAPSFTLVLLGGLICYSVFLGISILGLLRGIIGDQSITRDTIRGSLAVYLLIGVLWALLYRMVFILNPAEFSESIRPGMLPEFLYFSFTTLTTLGYGDISPLGPVSRALTQLEAIAGPVFLAVLVSRLVGQQVGRS